MMLIKNLIKVFIHSDFYDVPKAKRQKNFMKTFKAPCECEACVKDFPTYENLPVNHLEMFKKLYFGCLDHDILALPFDAALAKFKENCEFLKNNRDDFPTKELCLAQTKNNSIMIKFSKLAAKRDGFHV